MSADSLLVEPDWPTPPGIRAFITTREGGVSCAPYESFNLGDHVGDQQEAVATNRTRFADLVPVGCTIPWLTQVHGTTVVQAEDASCLPEADASWTCQQGVACVVLTADCLPVLFCSRDGRYIAAVHAGWRGLLDGILEATLAQAPVDNDQLMAWLGPAIGPAVFEVGAEVREGFLNATPSAAAEAVVEASFIPVAERNGHYLADLYALARQRLLALGVSGLYGGHWCTYSDRRRFFSYRREGKTGRMASLILRE